MYSYLILYVFLQFQITQQSGSKCTQIIHGDAIFQLGNLSDDEDLVAQMEDDSVLYYKICQYAQHQCKRGDIPSYGIVYDKTSGQCLKLTGEQEYIGFQYYLLDPEDPNKGLVLKLDGGDRLRKIKHILECDPHQQTEYNLKGIRFVHSKLEYQIWASSPYACPAMRITSIEKFFNRHGTFKFFLATLFGFGWCFYGRRLFELSMCIIGFLITFIFLMFYIEEFIFDSTNNPFLLWFMMFISIISGFVIGYFAMKVPKIGLSFTGIWMGITITLLIQNAVLYKFGIETDDIRFYFVLVGISNVLALLAWLYFQNFVIIFTSSVGVLIQALLQNIYYKSYFLLQPIGYTLGNFPDKVRIEQLIYYKSIFDMHAVFILWVCIIIAQAVIGIRYQQKQLEQGKSQLYLKDIIPDIPEIFHLNLGHDEEEGPSYIEMAQIQNKEGNDYINIGLKSDDENDDKNYEEVKKESNLSVYAHSQNEITVKLDQTKLNFKSDDKSYDTLNQLSDSQRQKSNQQLSSQKAQDDLINLSDFDNFQDVGTSQTDIIQEQNETPLQKIQEESHSDDELEQKLQDFRKQKISEEKQITPIRTENKISGLL